MLNVNKRELYVKVGNMTDQTKTVNIDLSRFSVKPNAVRTVLSGKLDDENNYDKHPVSPVKSDFKAAKKMTLDIQPRSLEMITIQL